MYPNQVLNPLGSPKSLFCSDCVGSLWYGLGTVGVNFLSIFLTLQHLFSNFNHT